jgi:hypothetical protein
LFDGGDDELVAVGGEEEGASGEHEADKEGVHNAEACFQLIERANVVDGDVVEAVAKEHDLLV